MMLRSVVQTSLLLLLIAANSVVWPFCQRLKTVEELLTNYQIELTKSGLIKALHNPNPDVRWLAAQKLANDRATDALPAMEEALNRDWHIPQNRVNIAYALAQLENSNGLRTLQSACGDSDLKTSLRLTATRYMLDLGKRSCLMDVIKTLENDSDAASQIEALSLLPRFSDVPADDYKKALQAIVKSLSDHTPAVRLGAAGALASLGERSSIKELTAAIEREKDQAVRNHMLQELRRLEETVKTKQP